MADPSDSDDDYSEIVELLEWAIDQKRKYAGFWSWPDREVAERGVAQELLDGIGPHVGGRCLRVRSTGAGNDPPDCVADLEAGGQVGIEVTELVDQAHAGGSPTKWAFWDVDKFRSLINQRLHRKDDPSTVKGGPYVKYIVALHTDEPLLSAAQVREYLQGATFGPFRLIDAAWVVVSHEPPDGCLCIPVPFTRQDA